MTALPDTTPPVSANDPPMQRASDEGSTPGARAAALAAMVVLLGIVLLQVYRAAPPAGSFRDFSYTQDKAYVDLLAARELAGLDAGPNRFAGATPLAATAAPGWVVLLAGLMRTSGLSNRSPEEIALLPLGLNMVAAALLVLLVGHLIRREVTGGSWMFLTLVGLGLVIPLPLVVMSGTEHLAHAVAMLLAIAVSIAAVEKEESSLLLNAASVVALVVNISLRPEGLAALVAVVLWAWVRQRTPRLVPALLIGLGLFVGTGVYLKNHGAGFLPNPVLVHAAGLLKGNWRTMASGLAEGARHDLSQAGLPWTLLILAAGVLVVRRGHCHSPQRPERERVAWLLVFVIVALAYVLFGRADRHYWHEAYLLPLAFVAVARSIASAEWKGSRHGAGIAAVACAVPVLLAMRPVVDAFRSTPQMARDALVRDRATAAFVRTYFPGGPVATNRPGAAGYTTNARLIDLSGVMSHELALALARGEYDAERLGRIVNQAGAQVVLFSGPADARLPAGWTLLGGWYRDGTARDSESGVRVYAVSAAMESDVRIALQLFSESPQPVPGIEYWFVPTSKTQRAENAALRHPVG